VTEQAVAEPTGLIDVSQLPLRDLWTRDDDSVLGAAIRRAVGDLEEPGRVSAFNSAV
jgi:hypothetical protein